MQGSGLVMLMQCLNAVILASMGPSKAGKIQCVVMDFHAENEYTVFKIFRLIFYQKVLVTKICPSLNGEKGKLDKNQK